MVNLITLACCSIFIAFGKVASSDIVGEHAARRDQCTRQAANQAPMLLQIFKGLRANTNSCGPEVDFGAFAPHKETRIVSNVERSCSVSVALGDRPSEQHCQAGSFNGHPLASDQRLALVLRGEAFRTDGGQYNRNTGGQHAWEAQEKASLSQVQKLVMPFERCGFRVDVFIASYDLQSTLPCKFKRIRQGEDGKSCESCNYTANLLDFYGGRVVAARWEDHHAYSEKGLEAQGLIYKLGLELVARHHAAKGVAYNAIIVSRLDMIWKQPLASLPGIDWSKTHLAFKLMERFMYGWNLPASGPSPDARPLVTDVVQYFPWRFANCAEQGGFMEHNFAAIGGLVGQDNLAYFVPGGHDADTAKDTNQLYELIRPSQKYEVHAGVALLLVGSQPIRNQADVKHVAQMAEVMRNNQGDPPMPWVDVFAHFWAPVALREKLNLATRPLHPEDVLVESISALAPGEVGSFAAWQSSVKAAVHLMQRQETRVATKYDAVAILNIGATVTKSYQLYSFDTDNTTYARFSKSAAANAIPEVLLLSSQVSAQLASSTSVVDVDLRQVIPTIVELESV